MKTKNVFKLMAILIAVVGINIAGCKKDHSTSTSTTPDTSSLSQLAKDDSQVQASDDEISNDANATLSSSSAKSMDTLPVINSCTITVDTVGATKDTLQITLLYTGFNTGHNFSRTGTVVITRPLGVQWKTQGCAVTFKYIQLAVTKVSTGKTFMFDGTRTWTNISGGLIKNLNGSSATVTHQITGQMQITFDYGTANSSTRTWYIYRQRVWGGTFPTALTVTVSGFGSNSGYSNLVEYGTNRNGEPFFSSINTPILYDYNTCIAYQFVPIWGSLTHQIPSANKSATLTFGYTSSGTLVTQGSCATYYLLSYNIKGTTGTILLPIL
jgi:hypothetical protein